MTTTDEDLEARLRRIYPLNGSRWDAFREAHAPRAEGWIWEEGVGWVPANRELPSIDELNRDIPASWWPKVEGMAARMSQETPEQLRLRKAYEYVERFERKKVDSGAGLGTTTVGTYEVPVSRKRWILFWALCVLVSGAMVLHSLWLVLR